MSRPFLTTKAKRNNFTLTKEAQLLLDEIPATKKSKTVSAAIIFFLNYDLEKKWLSKKADLLM